MQKRSFQFSLGGLLACLICAGAMAQPAAIDVSDWESYCIGEFTVKAPSELKYQQELSTHIDYNYVQITRAFQGSAHDGILAHNRLGQIILEDKLNGWEFVIAHQKPSEAMEFGSGEGIVFYGARKIGDSLILLERTFESDTPTDEQISEQRAVFERLNVEEIPDPIPPSGICIDGYLFSGYAPRLAFDFSASFTPPTSSTGEFLAQRFLSIWFSADASLSISDESYDEPALERELMSASDPEMPEIGLDGRKTDITIFENDFGTEFMGATRDAPDQIAHPLIEIEYWNPNVDASQSEQEFIAVLQNIERRDAIDLANDKQ